MRQGWVRETGLLDNILISSFKSFCDDRRYSLSFIVGAEFQASFFPRLINGVDEAYLSIYIHSVVICEYDLSARFQLLCFVKI